MPARPTVSAPSGCYAEAGEEARGEVYIFGGAMDVRIGAETLVNKTIVVVVLSMLAIAPGLTTLSARANDTVEKSKAQATEGIRRNPKAFSAWFTLSLLGLLERDGEAASKNGAEALNILQAAPKKLDLDLEITRGFCGMSAYFGYEFANNTTKAKQILQQLQDKSDKSSWILPLLKHLRHEPGAPTAEEILVACKSKERQNQMAVMFAYDAILNGQQDLAKKLFERAESEVHEELFRIVATAELKRMNPRHVPAPSAVAKNMGVYDTSILRTYIASKSAAFAAVMNERNQLRSAGKFDAAATEKSRQKMEKLMKQADVDIALAVREEAISKNVDQIKDISEYSGPGIDLTDGIKKRLDQIKH